MSGVVQRRALPDEGPWVLRPARDFSASPFTRIGEDWMLVTAGSADSWNTMTASWGGLGVLWGKDVAFVFVRPSRHSYGFLEAAERFTLSFFGSENRGALAFCGAHSGRDTDKAAGAGLTPIVLEEGTVAFAEAREILACRKLYAQDIEPSLFLDPRIAEHYPEKDYHRLYIAELESLRVRP